MGAGILFCYFSSAKMAARGPIREKEQAGDVVVDALLGTGLAGSVRPGQARAIAWMNASARPVLALDIPSGLCSDTGNPLGSAVRATRTISFIGRNLWLSTKYKGVDPETSLTGASNSLGMDYFNMPGTKSYGLSLRVTL